MAAGLRGRVSKSKLVLYTLYDSVPSLYSINESTVSLVTKSRFFSSIDRNKYRYKEGDEREYRNSSQNPPEPIPNRPLRRERPNYNSPNLPSSKFGNDDNGGSYNRSVDSFQKNKPSRIVGGNRKNTQSIGSDLFKFDEFENDGDAERMRRFSPSSQTQRFVGGRNVENPGNDFLEKFKLGVKPTEKPISNDATAQIPGEEESKEGNSVSVPPAPSPPQDADEIFRKMKETGLIPNAVAMLDGLCKDGLVQEAMKLFGLMREKGTIPEVVIYTAVVEGFCKAQKFDDAKRIFRKMQSNGISANAFSYSVLIQGLYKGGCLEDAVDFCVEMLEAGHSPNLTTFTGLVDGFCREKGVEEAQSMIGTLKQKGFFFDEKALRDYLEKKVPFLQLVWEAVFGKKTSERSF